MNSLVSVIVPVYNTEQYIERCLQSIINQTWKNIEIIVVDDLSTDNSPLIINNFCQNYPFIYNERLSEKKGTGGARNRGLHLARGKYISFVDSDDWIDLQFIEKMVIELERNNSDIAISGVLTEFENPKDAILRYNYEFKNKIEGKYAFKLLTRRDNQDSYISPIVCNKIYKTSFIKDNMLAFKSNSYNEDDYFNFLAFYFAKDIILVPTIFYHYYQRNNSITKVLEIKHINDFVDCFLDIKSFLIRENIFDKFQQDYFSYFEKCLSFLLEVIDKSYEKNNVKEQYIFRLFLQCKSIVSSSEYLQYVGLRRIRKFMDYNIK